MSVTRKKPYALFRYVAELLLWATAVNRAKPFLILLHKIDNEHMNISINSTVSDNGKCSNGQ